VALDHHDILFFEHDGLGLGVTLRLGITLRVSTMFA
jgi:hypothetical protein